MKRNKRDLRIVFMGTPDFAVHILKSLVEEEFNIVGVVTVADKPAGRGKKLQMSAVKKYAISQDLNVLTPLKLKDAAFLTVLKGLQADIQIVVAFRMLPEVVWSMPELGTFNLHASLLPQYRGAAPINHAIINGESKTGVTTFFLDHKIDTGKIISRKECAISPNETAGELHDKLMLMGGALVIESLFAIMNDEVQPLNQHELEDGDLKEAPKIFKDQCQIAWNQTAQVIYDFVRGLSPYPAAHTFLTKSDSEAPISMKIFKLNHTHIPSKKTAGSISMNDQNKFLVSTKDFDLEILELQLQGKKRMLTEDFLRGFSIIEPMRFIEKS